MKGKEIENNRFMHLYIEKHTSYKVIIIWMIVKQLK